MSLPSAAASKYALSPGFNSGSAIFLSWYGVAIVLFPFHDQRRAAVTVSNRAAGAVSEGERAARHLDVSVSFAAKLAHRFDDFGHAAAVRGVVVAQAAAV